MAPKTKSSDRSTKVVAVHIPVVKKTSIGGNKHSLSTSMMNKHKRKSHKSYRGQGKP